MNIYETKRDLRPLAVENLYLATIHTFFILSIVYVMFIDIDGRCSTFYRLSSMWSTYPYPLTSSERWLHHLAIGYYLFAIWCVLFVDERRRDFNVMVIHHIATLYLLVMCMAARVHRLGLLVLLVHDACDIWLDIAKFTLYLKVKENGDEDAMLDKVTTVSFSTLVITW